MVLHKLSFSRNPFRLHHRYTTSGRQSSFSLSEHFTSTRVQASSGGRGGLYGPSAAPNRYTQVNRTAPKMRNSTNDTLESFVRGDRATDDGGGRKATARFRPLVETSMQQRTQTKAPQTNHSNLINVTHKITQCLRMDHSDQALLKLFRAIIIIRISWT